jgi:D-alanyl-lipoteichoic acid acyltransferase DltB (MBOAT superfamily)
MLFNSLIFLGFLAVVLLIYPRLKLRGQNLFLLAASYVFYGTWDWRFTSLLAVSTIVDYYVGRHLHASDDVKRRKRLLLLSVCVNLGILGFFKYFNFFADSLSVLLAGVGFAADMPTLRIVLPVGISFYTFQTMSYTIDIYRRRLEPTRNFIDFALFVSFFPQLVAGPIERARVLLPQIAAPRTVDRRLIYTGINLILMGYFKKVAIADTLSPIVESAFSNPAGLSSGALLTGVYGFAFQVYGDFSGYTDIARGVARLLGFELMENFNAPYLSRSITEFWRRWHISLSTWLRDYLYIALGGSRKGSVRTYVNLFLTMLLAGLWHGAAWTFVVFGALHGVYLTIERIRLGGDDLDMSWPTRATGWLRQLGAILLTFHLHCISLVLFRSPSVASAWVYLKGIARFDDPLAIGTPVLFAMGAMTLWDAMQIRTGNHTWLTSLPRPVRFVIVQMLLVSIVAAAIHHVNTVVPFIYFQF